MRTLVRYAAAVILLCGAAAAAPQRPGFDFSAVEQTWKIAGILERDQEPDAAEWAALFQSPGYRELMRREPYLREDIFQNNIRLAFMPSKAAARKDALEKRPNSTAAHFARIRDRRDDLRRLQSDLERGNLMDLALDKARALLPPGAMKGEPTPPISFIFFAPDGRGYVPIIIDLLYAAEKKDALVDFIAHEAHHYYRNQNRAYDEGEIRLIDEGLLNGLDQLQIEGVADQIDKHERYYRSASPETSAYADSFRKNVAESPRILAEVIRRLEQAAEASNHPSGILDILPQSGHPTGYFMARTIIDQGDEPLMINTVGNPFAFIYLYNRAAAKNGSSPVFSRKALEYLRGLELAYCREPETALYREAVPGGFDSSAIDVFWKIADQLALGNEPSPAEWARLVDHPAYAELSGHEGRAYAPETVKDRMALVFKPSRAEELQNKLKQGADGLTRHFAILKPKRAEIDSYLKSLGTADLAARVMADVRPYLPSDLVESMADPAFTSVFFSPDLRYGYSLFLFDPSYGAERPDSIEYYARFFTLNYFRNGRLTYDPVRLKVKHAEAVDLLASLEKFGFMENIRPKNTVFAGDPARKDADGKAYQAALMDMPAIVARLDQILAEIEQTPEKTSAWMKLSLMDVPLEGRPVGFFMARAIIDRLGKERLAVVLGDPFGFVRLYNEAAALPPGPLPCFSEAAVRLISRLEKEYRR